MRHVGLLRGVVLGVLLLGLLTTAGAAPERLPPPAPRFVPKFAALAETKLLMEGLAQANYRGLEKILKDKPADAETWTFARGQALLIGETGNLLLLRPPRNGGRDTWMKKAMAMRDAAGDLARDLGARDYERSLAGMRTLAVRCNACHDTFRVPVHVGPAAPGRDTKPDTK